MFGMPGLPDMTEMVRTIEDAKNKFTRLVIALETMQRDIEAIKSHLNIDKCVLNDTWRCSECGANSGAACNANGCFANERSEENPNG